VRWPGCSVVALAVYFFTCDAVAGKGSLVGALRNALRLICTARELLRKKAFTRGFSNIELLNDRSYRAGRSLPSITHWRRRSLAKKPGLHFWDAAVVVHLPIWFMNQWSAAREGAAPAHFRFRHPSLMVRGATGIWCPGRIVALGRRAITIPGAAQCCDSSRRIRIDNHDDRIAVLILRSNEK
jgi:hypothetical protein